MERCLWEAISFILPSHMHIIQISLQHMNKSIKCPTPFEMSDEKKYSANIKILTVWKVRVYEWEGDSPIKTGEEGMGGWKERERETKA